MTTRELQEELATFARERDWGQFHNPKNLVMALAGETGELVSLFQWLTAEESASVMADRDRAAAVREEMADVFAYLLQLADVIGVDLEDALRRKIEVNRKRYPVALARGRADRPTTGEDGGA
ncbi:nucleotide pyrophosphohydrolase [Streptomyces sp. 4N509B]|uniref:nucleotide pyrophosphohydrolase n=1 Tax=Streptomyces sp. 4N509B TaxID=3457413 RepID=UPI003FD2DCF8